ncbi:MAG TPA: hypothetical protein PLY93_06080 [Turneriella sp.]|nr:hypothetical protein [Turneriella sp.]
MKFFYFISLFLVLGVKPKTVWVVHEYIGGAQCVTMGKEAAFTAPGFIEASEPFIKNRIAILRSYFRDLPVCQACHTCARYRRQIWFEIEEKYLQKASQVGFTPSNENPTDDELAEYKRSKKFEPKVPMPQGD